MGMTHPAIANDDGSGGSGTVWNDAWETLHDTAIDAAIAAVAPALPGTSAPTTTGTQTAFAIPTGTGDLVIYAANASLLTVQGITAGRSGQRLTIVSKGAGRVDFAHLHASGTALGKLKLFATSGLTSLAPGSGVATFQYDATVTQWRLLHHEQGAWLTPTYAGGTYVGGGTMVFTVDSGDVVGHAYHLKGRTLTVQIYLTTTSISGTLTSFVTIALPGGFVPKGYANGAVELSDNGVLTPGYAYVADADPTIYLFRADGANWAAAVNTGIVRVSIRVEVT